jgi:uncharacterized protein (DUF58 family)
MTPATAQRPARIPYQMRWRAQQRRLGQHRSRQRGEGVEFDQLKESCHGDSWRAINWAATARRGGTPLLINTYYEDKDITIMLLVDVSASMDFGSVRLAKKTLAAEISAALVYSALAAHDRIGLLSFTSQVEHYIPPRQARGYQQAIPEAIRHGASAQRRANFTLAVSGLEARLKGAALVFLLSDFLTDDFQGLSQALTRLQARHDLIALVLSDPREEALPPGYASMAIRDLETHEVVVYDFSPRNRQRMAATAQAQQWQLQQLLQRLGVAAVRLTPASNYVEDLTQLFRSRQRTRG